jgi:hypothetical protein
MVSGHRLRAKVAITHHHERPFSTLTYRGTGGCHRARPTQPAPAVQVPTAAATAAKSLKVALIIGGRPPAKPRTFTVWHLVPKTAICDPEADTGSARRPDCRYRHGRHCPLHGNWHQQFNRPYGIALDSWRAAGANIEKPPAMQRPRMPA